jgi:hypothetical protein
LKQNTAGLDLAARRGHTSLVSFSRSVVMRCLDELTAPRRYEGLNRRGRRQYAQASGRLLWLGFEMHYVAHLSFAGSGVFNQIIHLFLLSTSAKNRQCREPQLSQSLLNSTEDKTSNRGGGVPSSMQSN